MRQPKKFNPVPFEYHQEVELEIKTLTNLGVGLGRVGDWVVMVPYTVPGERVVARIYKNNKNYSEGDLVRVVQPAAERVTPQCALFGTCGGCQYQHMTYEAQLLWKERHTQEVFERIGKVRVQPSPTIGSPKEYAYRSKITPHFEATRAGKPFNIGFLKQGTTHQIVDVPQCPIASEAINKALVPLRNKTCNGHYVRGGTLLLRDTLTGVCTDPKATVQESIGPWTYEFVAGEFFQNNPWILPRLLEYVTTQAQSPKVRYLIDAYCGVGVFSIAAHAQFERCVGIEVSEPAAALAKANAVRNKAHNCSFVAGEAEQIFKHIDFRGAESSVIIDPPRKGCDVVFLEQLVAFGPERIVYVSCAPDTQARDAAWLLEKGYEIAALQPFDLFPQTRHIESVLVLQKR